MRVAPGIQWVETAGAAKRFVLKTRPSPASTKNDLAQNVISAKIEKLMLCHAALDQIPNNFFFLVPEHLS